MSDNSTKFHPALSITNVKSLIPITLDNETGLYHSWATLFKVQVRVHNLLHHIDPPTDVTAKTKIDALKAADPELYDRLDAVVLQWIYGTISPDLLQSILFKDDSAAKAWRRLEAVFQDNKGSRATHLVEELAAVSLENFSSADAYCNHVKSLADRLADVDAPVSNSRLVLRLIGGLPEAYSGTVDYVQNQDPLPLFENVRSRIKLAERTMKNRASKEGGGGGSAALLATAGGIVEVGSSSRSHNYSSFNNNNGRNNSKNKKKINNNGRGDGHRGNNRGGGGSQTSGAGGNNQQARQQQWQPRPVYMPQYVYPPYGQWTAPPCPYPTAQWQQARPASRPNSILGPRPQQQQAYQTSVAPSTVGYTPTDIEAAMHTFAITPPDGNWYMDTGATSHSTSDQVRSTTNLGLQVLSFFQRQNAQNRCEIDTSDGISGIMRLVDSTSPAEFEKDTVLCVFYELPDCCPLVPCLLAGVEYPEKTIFESDIMKTTLWHEYQGSRPHTYRSNNRQWSNSNSESVEHFQYSRWTSSSNDRWNGVGSNQSLGGGMQHLRISGRTQQANNNGWSSRNSLSYNTNNDHWQQTNHESSCSQGRGRGAIPGSSRNTSNNFWPSSSRWDPNSSTQAHWRSENVPKERWDPNSSTQAHWRSENVPRDQSSRWTPRGGSSQSSVTERQNNRW